MRLAIGIAAPDDILTWSIDVGDTDDAETVAAKLMDANPGTVPDQILVVVNGVPGMITMPGMMNSPSVVEHWNAGKDYLRGE